MTENKHYKAYKFAKHKHEGQVDDDNMPYVLHCIEVRNIVMEVTEDRAIWNAAILHDTIEDTDTTYEELKEEFGQRIADLVMEVTHEGTNDNYGYYFPRLKSKEGIIIKLADRLSNISRMQNWDEERQQHYLKRTKFWKDGSDRE